MVAVWPIIAARMEAQAAPVVRVQYSTALQVRLNDGTLNRT